MANDNQTRTSYVEFVPPQNWRVPEGDGNPDGEFDLVCTFKPKSDGRICMVKFGTIDMPQKKDKDEAPSYRGMSEGIVSDLSGQSETETY